jgi:hypothetical protein
MQAQAQNKEASLPSQEQTRLSHDSQQPENPKTECNILVRSAFRAKLSGKIKTP